MSPLRSIHVLKLAYSRQTNPKPYLGPIQVYDSSEIDLDLA